MNSPSNSTERADRLFMGAMAFEVGLGLLAVLLGLWSGIDGRASIPKWHAGGLLAWSAMWGIIAAIPLIAMGLLLERLPWSPLIQLRKSVEIQLMTFFRSMTWPQLGCICMAAGVCEEMLFRGWLQAALLQWLGPYLPHGVTLVVALLASSLVFGFCHYLNLAYLIFATIFGLYFGILFYFCENLLIPIIAHAVYDTVIVFWILRSSPR
ncbi:MAG: CPBP family intramembrane glutamic endopeptidase [Pirellulales bacterium]